MRKIKVLLLGMSSNIGGIEIYLYNLVKNADLSKFQFDFLHVGYDYMALEEEISKLGCKIYKIEARNKNYAKHMKELKVVFDNNYDYIHYNIMTYSWCEPILLSKKYKDTKLIIHSHNGSKDFLKTVGILSRILHYIGKFRTRNIGSFKVSCSEKAGNYIFGKSKFIIFDNGIDFDMYKFSKKNRYEIRNELDILDDTFVIGLVAAFLPVKNHKYLLNVFNKYLEYNSNSKLVLVGEGYEKNSIENMALELGIKDKVLFLGKRMDTYKIYSALDVYVMPSISEGFSISLCEAQVNGLKCYVSDSIDRKTDISGNVNFLSLKDDYEEWAKRIYMDFKRDVNVLDKVSNIYNSKESYKMVYKFYVDNGGNYDDR